MKTYTKAAIIQRYGEEVLNRLINSNPEPTGRLMYPAFEDTSHIGKIEWAGDVVEVGDDRIQAYWYLEDDDDPEMFDWEEGVEFQIE